MPFGSFTKYLSIVCIASTILLGCGGGGGPVIPEKAKSTVRTSSISLNPLTENGFDFYPDTGNRSDKVIGTMEFTVSDLTNGGYIRDLTTENFKISERDFGTEDEYVVEVEATQDSDLEVTPIDVLYVIDKSFSVVESSADDDLIRQANSLAAEIKKINDLGLSTDSSTKYISFGDKVDALRTSSSDSPFNSLVFEEKGGGTALYQAIYTALTTFDVNSKNPLLFVFTDGRENASAVGYDKQTVITLAQDYGIPIFIAGLGNVDKTDLEDIASNSGGEVFIADDVDQLAEAFNDLLRSIPVTYTAVYRPTQRSGHKQFQFTVTYSNASDNIVDDFDVDAILQ